MGICSKTQCNWSMIAFLLRLSKRPGQCRSQPASIPPPRPLGAWFLHSSGRIETLRAGLAGEFEQMDFPNLSCNMPAAHRLKLAKCLRSQGHEFVPKKSRKCESDCVLDEHSMGMGEPVAPWVWLTHGWMCSSFFAGGLPISLRSRS